MLLFSGKINITFSFGFQQFSARLLTTQKLMTAMPVAAARWNVCQNDIIPSYDGRRIWIDDTPASLRMEDGDTVDFQIEQKGGKPVIYLYSPSEVTATVKLSLVPAWSFSAIYPVVPIGSDASGEQKLEWKVTTKADGTLREHNVGVDVAYLFWEALCVLFACGHFPETNISLT